MGKINKGVKTMVITISHNSTFVISFRIFKCLVYIETFGVKINPLKIVAKVEPTFIGLQSIKLTDQWTKMGFTRGNEVGFGLIKFMWYL